MTAPTIPFERLQVAHRRALSILAEQEYELTKDRLCYAKAFAKNDYMTHDIVDALTSRHSHIDAAHDIIAGLEALMAEHAAWETRTLPGELELDDLVKDLDVRYIGKRNGDLRFRQKLGSECDSSDAFREKAHDLSVIVANAESPAIKELRAVTKGVMLE